jgi:hypothetical protein
MRDPDPHLFNRTESREWVEWVAFACLRRWEIRVAEPSGGYSAVVSLRRFFGFSRIFSSISR